MPKAKWNSDQTHALIDERKKRNMVNILIWKKFVNNLFKLLVDFFIQYKLYIIFYRNIMTLRARFDEISETVLRTMWTQPVSVNFQALNVSENLLRWPRATT